MMATRRRLGIALAALFWAGAAQAYPLDGYPLTGILRLEAYRLAQQGKVLGPQEPKGALLGLDQVDLRLARRPNVELPAADPRFNAALAGHVVIAANGVLALTVNQRRTMWCTVSWTKVRN